MALVGPGAFGAAGVKYAPATAGAAQVSGEKGGSAGAERKSDSAGAEREGEGTGAATTGDTPGGGATGCRSRRASGEAGGASSYSPKPNEMRYAATDTVSINEGIDGSLILFMRVTHFVGWAT